MNSLTIKNLLSLIKNNDGKFKIGPLEFTKKNNDDADLNVYLNDKILMWIPDSCDINTPIDKAFTLHSYFKEDHQSRIKDLEYSNNRLRDELIETKEFKESLNRDFHRLKETSDFYAGQLDIYRRLFNRRMVISTNDLERDTEN